MRRILSDDDGTTLRYGAMMDLAIGTGIPIKKLRNTLTDGHLPLDATRMIVPIARYLEIPPMSLLDPDGARGVRRAAKAIDRGTALTGRAFRPVLLMAASPRGRTRLIRLAKAWCAENGVE